MEDEKWCSFCEIEEADYEYESEPYCFGCLLEKLEEEKAIDTWYVKHYIVNAEYIGNSNGDDLESIAEEIANRLKIKKI